VKLGLSSGGGTQPEGVREKLLTKISGSKARLHNQELYDMYSSNIKARGAKTEAACGKYDRRNANRDLVVIPEGKRPSGRPGVDRSLALI